MRLWVLFACAGWLAASTAGDLARGVGELELDPEACYRVRDLTLIKEDLRLYLTDGYLMFTKPLGGVRTSAAFVADVEGGDAEVLLLPPNKSERQTLASFIETPNLNEHFKAAVFVFSDDTYADLAAQIKSNPANRAVPELGSLLGPKWQSVVRNLAVSFESRLVLDLLSGRRAQTGFFFGAVTGGKLGNFDVVYDRRSLQQISVGQVAYRNDRAVYDTWTIFPGRTMRMSGKRPDAADWSEFELSDYRIEATLTPPDLRLSVVTRVKLKPTFDGEQALPFDISRQMQVTAVTVDGEAAEILTRDSVRSNLIRNTGNDLILVIPPKPLRAGEVYQLEFRHEGSVIADAGNKVYAVQSRANWYPARGVQFAQFDLTFRHPKDLVLVSTGELVSETVEGEWKVTRRRTATPVRLAGFNLGVYIKSRVARGNTTVEVYANRAVERALQPRPQGQMPIPVPGGWPRPPRRDMMTFPAETAPPPDPTARLHEMAEQISGAFEFMAARFGPPPVRNLTVSPVPGTFGQGFPGLIYLSTLSYLGSKERVVKGLPEELQTFFSEMLAAHETAHQWWGNIVTAASYQDEWILESAANYSALLYIEKRKGAKTLDQVLDRYRANLLEKHEGRTVESAGAIALGTRLYNSPVPGAWRIITYEKGSWILHMLRRRMGDERFLSMLGEMRRRFQRKAISTDEFRTLAAGFLPPGTPDSKLEAFFDQWVYATGIPALKLAYTVRGKAPQVKVTATVTQTDVPGDFSVLAPVEIQFGRGKPVVKQIRTSEEPATVTVTVPQLPVRVVLDPASSVLAARK